MSDNSWRFQRRVPCLNGERIGKLVCLDDRHERRGASFYGLFLCECGQQCVKHVATVRKGIGLSCGCDLVEKLGNAGRKHGKHKTRAYRAWQGMKTRCKPSDEHAPNYSERGIVVCKHWLKFENFYADMGDPPSDLHTLDRIDVNGPYAPDNCRWATMKEQNNNKTINIKVHWNGIEFPSLMAAAEHSGLSYATLRYRLSHGWSVEKAMTAPLQKHGGPKCTG
jgi:hypothetical protein